MLSGFCYSMVAFIMVCSIYFSFLLPVFKPLFLQHIRKHCKKALGVYVDLLRVHSYCTVCSREGVEDLLHFILKTIRDVPIDHFRFSIYQYRVKLEVTNNLSLLLSFLYLCEMRTRVQLDEI